MRHFERRQQQAFPYFKLARWDSLSLTFRDGKRAFATQAKARADARAKGRYRISIVEEAGRRDLEPFDVNHVIA